MPLYDHEPHTKDNGPDEFVSFFDKLYHKAYANGPLTLAILGIIAFVCLGIFFWSQFHSIQDQKLARRIYEAQKEGPEAEEKLFSDLRKKNLYAPIGIWASLELADDLMKQSQCDKVLDTLTMYVGHGEDSVLRTLVYSQVGTCLENKKDWNKAAEHYSQAADDSKNFLRDWSELRLAYAKQQLGQGDAAQRILQKLSATDSKASPAVKAEASLWLQHFSFLKPQSEGKS